MGPHIDNTHNNTLLLPLASIINPSGGLVYVLFMHVVQHRHQMHVLKLLFLIYIQHITVTMQYNDLDRLSENKGYHLKADLLCFKGGLHKHPSCRCLQVGVLTLTVPVTTIDCTVTL